MNVTGRNLLLGAVAGVVGVWALDRTDGAAYRRVGPAARARTRAVRPRGEPPSHVAAAALERTVGAPLGPRGHEAAGNVVHYLIGLAPAAVYAALRPRLPRLTAGRGTLYGFALFLLQDELLNTVTGLGAKPRAYPWQAHVRGLVAHLVYGLVTEGVLRASDRRPPTTRVLPRPVPSLH